MDRDALWSAGYDESVEVNQRALIDKVLARYSGEFTVFRELLQNSDDAASEAVEIRFETNIQANNVEISNSTEGNPDEEKIGAFGVGFYSLFSVTEEPFVKSGDQWMGFYWRDKKDQLFARRGNLPALNESDTYREWTTFDMELREPAPVPSISDFIRFLTSSITFMVHLRRVTVWFDTYCLATVTKDVGIPKEIPFPKYLKRKSEGNIMTMVAVKTRSMNITVETLRMIYTIGTETKQPLRASSSVKPSVNSGFFSSLFASFTGSSEQTPAPITPSPSPIPNIDPMSNVISHVILTIYSGEVNVSLDQKMVAELYRSTKKNPPSRLKLELIYTGKDEYDMSERDEDVVFKKPGSLFQGLRADLDGTGSARIFIGHSTAQTTGIGGHISGRFIPTVERESIDLVDRNVAVWNRELLWIGGLLARVAYEVELTNIRALWEGSTHDKLKPDNELRTWLQGRCLHALQFFSFHVSTPSATVSTLLEAAFFACSANGYFPILSTSGVMDARNVRRFDPTYAEFLKDLPVLHDDVARNAQLMVSTLRGRVMLRDISFTDVLTELRARPLPEADMVALLKWRIGLNTEGIPPLQLVELRREFIEAAILLTTDESRNDKLICLTTIKTVHIPRNATAIIPLDIPMPVHTLPISVSRLIQVEALLPLFGWTELTVPMWTEHLFSTALLNGKTELNVTLSPVFAERVLNVLCRAWGSLPKEHQAQVVRILHDKSCIPTKFGMKLPQESYFQNANVFPDLPIIAMPKGTAVRGTMEKLMLELGVKQHVDLQVVFARMIQTGDWDIHDLIRYLVAVESSLTSIEIERLKETAAFSREESETQNNASGSDGPLKRKYRARDLYEPSPALRELGLPLLTWTTSPKWKPSSEEAKFLFRLGLKKYPELKDLLFLAASDRPAIRSAAFKYFFDNYSSRYSHYEPEAFSSLAFIPARKPDGSSFFGMYQEVFKAPEYTIMGFSVIDPGIPSDWVLKLGLSPAPSVKLLIPILRTNPPRDVDLARKWFELLAGRLSDFSTAHLQYLSTLDFIPVTNLKVLFTEGSKPAVEELHSRICAITFVAPNKCYLSKDKNSEGGNQGFRSQLFTFVDFGQRANAFLTACGVRQEPSVDELAQMLVANPRKFYELAGGYDRFLAELLNIAINLRGVSMTTRNQMKKVPCLVGSRRISLKGQSPVTKSKKDVSRIGGESDDEDEKKLEHELLLPSQIAIVDDLSAHIMFDIVFTAPQEDNLEHLYISLGSPLISSIVKEEYRPSMEIRDSQRANEMRRLVLERLPLFLHERTPGYGAQGKSAFSYSWLNTPGNFIVIEVGKLVLIRSLQFSGNRSVKQQEVSATASQTGSRGKGPVQMWIAGNSQVDLYEWDPEIFMTILSTDLRALRRRGFNVDRVLRQQKAEREQQLREQQQLLEAHQGRRSDESSTARTPIESGGNLANHVLQDTRKSSLFSNWRQKLLKSPAVGDANGLPSGPNLPGAFPGVNNNASRPPETSALRPWSQTSNGGITPQENIERNVRAAIDACKPESDAVIRSREQRIRVDEAVDDRYCDVTGAIDLVLITSIGPHQVFISSEFNPSVRMETIESLRPAIERFVKQVLQPLLALYGLLPESVNVFYDSAGPLIAFNRSGRIFVNVRYYNTRHDEDVKRGQNKQALVSWYHSLAHELAHNLVHPHNSEHEFYFSTISEHYMIVLAELLGETS
ncbi:hypothetical protein Clacol_008856 [Clathrus columnatus]|uniref:Sacsin n=1 Tax=Clathrus columnatus TaxID=1419009 RepID=A0AAV5ARR9_9AGAM|nr:hypothetical protein Clacol_008856 [Clathrus columnatus]